MKKLLLLAALPLALLSACASVETSTQGNSRGAANAGDTLYCWKSRLQAEGDALSCNWARSAKAACEESYLTKLEKSALSMEPKDASRCENGQWLVQVARR